MDFLEKIKLAGIVGAGGAGFPTHVKLNTKAQWLIINGAECEPLIETDKYIMRTFADELITAAIIISKHLQAEKIVFALKSKYKVEILALQQAIDKTSENIEIFQMKSFYPAGDEQTLVSEVTGKTVPERSIPISVGAVVENVGTLAGIYNAVVADKPVSDKFLSVTGEVQKTIMLNVPIGTRIIECIKVAQPKDTDFAVILGGPMMGRILKTKSEIENAVVTKTTGNILVLPVNHMLINRTNQSMERIKLQTHSACIQCRMCTDLCPRYIIGHQIRPNLIMRNLYRVDTIKDDNEFLKAFGDAANCCSCGVCELFACPMGLSPRRVNNYIKGELAKRKITVPKSSENPQKREFAHYRHVPTDRLVARLNLSKYYNNHATECINLIVNSVIIPLSQHIGKPANPCVCVGDIVAKSDIIANSAEGLSANIHASISGKITQLTDGYIEITEVKEG